MNTNTSRPSRRNPYTPEVDRRILESLDLETLVGVEGHTLASLYNRRSLLRKKAKIEGAPIPDVPRKPPSKKITGGAKHRLVTKFEAKVDTSKSKPERESEGLFKRPAWFEEEDLLRLSMRRR